MITYGKSDNACVLFLLLWLMVTFCVGSVCGYGQEEPSPGPSHDTTAAHQSSYQEIVTDDALSVLGSTGSLFTAPTRWDSGDWLTFSALVAVTGTSFLADNVIFDMMAHNRTPFGNSATRVLVRYGEYPSGLLVAGAYLTGLVIHDRWLRETALITANTLLASGIIAQVGKLTIGRARPYMGLGNHEFKPMNNSAGFKSMPSGHTYVAFSVSAVLAQRVKNIWASIGLYSLASASAMSRVYTENHWFSDVVFTALYTTSIAHSLVRRYEGTSGDGESTGVRIIPYPNGVSVVMGF